MISGLSIPNAKDEYYLINTIEFMKIVDIDDLSKRESEKIFDCYHIYWFEEERFSPPVFYLEKGVAKFINGRHRTLVLTKHMEVIPMALAHMDCSNFGCSPHPSSIKSLSNIVVKKLVNTDQIDLPDLPVKYLGFDLNIGK